MRLDGIGYRYSIYELSYLMTLYGGAWIRAVLPEAADPAQVGAAADKLERAGIVTRIQQSVCVENVTGKLMRCLSKCARCVGTGDPELLLIGDKVTFLLTLNGSEAVISAVSDTELPAVLEQDFRTPEGELYVFYTETGESARVKYETLAQSLTVF